MSATWQFLSPSVHHTHYHKLWVYCLLMFVVEPSVIKTSSDIWGSCSTDSILLWDVKLSNLVGRYQCFGGTCWLHFWGRWWRQQVPVKLWCSISITSLRVCYHQTVTWLATSSLKCHQIVFPTHDWEPESPYCRSYWIHGTFFHKAAYPMYDTLRDIIGRQSTNLHGITCKRQ